MTGKTGVIIVIPVTIVVFEKDEKCALKICATSSLLTTRKA